MPVFSNFHPPFHEKSLQKITVFVVVLWSWVDTPAFSFPLILNQR